MLLFFITHVRNLRNGCYANAFCYNVVLYVNLLKRVQGGLVLAMELTSKIKEFTYFTFDSHISSFRLFDLI